MRKWKNAPLVVFLLVLGVLAVIVLSNCSVVAKCARNNTGTLTVTNNTNDSIRVRIDGVNYGFINRGEKLEKDFAAGNKYLVETLWPNGKYACSPAVVTVVQCESRGLTCSATH